MSTRQAEILCYDAKPCLCLRRDRQAKPVSNYCIMILCSVLEGTVEGSDVSLGGSASASAANIYGDMTNGFRLPAGQMSYVAGGAAQKPTRKREFTVRVRYVGSLEKIFLNRTIFLKKKVFLIKICFY